MAHLRVTPLSCFSFFSFFIFRGVVLVHTVCVLNVHTGRAVGVCGGEEGGEGGFSVTHRHQHQHIAHQQHTQRKKSKTHNTQHRTRKVASSVLLTKICPPRRVIT